MFGLDLTAPGVPVAGTPPVQPNRPPPEQRVVEGTEQSRLQQQDTATLTAESQNALGDFADSVRQFVQILDATGNVSVASSVSGFLTGRIDIYA